MKLHVMEIEVRDAREIQAAHDRLVAILLGEVPSPFENPYWTTKLQICASVLCWVLQHQHNENFAEDLAEIDASMASRGIALVDSGELKVPKP